MRARVLAVLMGVLVLLLTPPAAGPVSAEEAWVWPVAGEPAVLRAFAPPATRYGPGHRGADVAAAPGASVRAAGAGRVTYAGLLAGRGVVTVTHGELRTTYEPVMASVRVGVLVAAGEVIGRLAASGHHCTGSCLHWGLLRGDVYLDPVRLVARGPSRLLPPDADALAAARAAPAAPVTVPSAAPAVGPPATLRPPADPAFSLRAAQAGWGATAVVALAAGLVLLRRPVVRRVRPPHAPPPPAAAAAPAAPLIDLTTERARRRVV